MTLLYTSNSSIDKGLFAEVSPRIFSQYVTSSGYLRYVNTSEFVKDIEYDKIDNITTVRKATLSEVTANGHWYWDRNNGRVYFYYDNTITESDSSYIVLVISLFVTTTFDVLAPANFDDDTFGDRIIWEGRLKETSFEQSCEDILSGKFGISTTNINIINNDSRYNPYAIRDVSFKNAKVSVWIVINEIANRKLIFKGVCQNATFQASDLSLDVIEMTKAIQQDATFKDDETWFTINANRWPSTKEQDRGKIIPMFLSGCSNKSGSKTKGAYNQYVAGSQVLYNEFEFYDCDYRNDLKGYYIGDHTDGKKFAVCRVLGTDELPVNIHQYSDKSTTPLLIDSISHSDIAIKSSRDISGTIFYGEFSITKDNNNIKLLYPGMHVYLRDTTSDTYHEMIVTFVDTVSKKFGVRDFRLVGNSTTNVIVSGHSYKLHYKGPTVYTIKDNVPVYLPTPQYFFMKEVTTGGNSLISVIITNDYNPGIPYQYLSSNVVQNFELYTGTVPPSAISEIPDLDYYCRFLNLKEVQDLSTYTLGKVTNVIPRLIPEIATDSSSDTLVTGNSYYDFSQKIGSSEYIDLISPPPNSEDNESYLQILEKILASTMSFMCIDNDGKLIIRFFEQIPYNSIELTLQEDDIKDGSVSSNIDFSEICSFISAMPYYSTDQAIVTSSESVRRICGDIKFNFNHYLKSNDTFFDKVKLRLDAYKLVPIKKYSFKVINKGYELTLGDRIYISFDNSGKWLGTNVPKSLFIVKIVKSLSGVEVTAIENTFPALTP